MISDSSSQLRCHGFPKLFPLLYVLTFTGPTHANMGHTCVLLCDKLPYFSLISSCQLPSILAEKMTCVLLILIGKALMLDEIIKLGAIATMIGRGK